MFSQAAHVSKQLMSGKVKYLRPQNSGRLDHWEFARHCMVSDIKGRLIKPVRHLYLTLEPTVKLP